MRRTHYWLAAACTLLLAAMAFDLDGWSLLDPDEGRNASVMRTMADGGDRLVPHLNGLPYADKPVLYFALGALAMDLLGTHETAARFPSMLFTLLTAVVLLRFGRRLLDWDGGWTAALAWLSTPFAIAYARTVIFDAVLVFWVVLSMAAFWEATHDAPRRLPAWSWSLIAWLAVGAGLLTKGPVVLMFPILVVLPWAVWRGDGRWRRVLDPVGLLGAVALVLPWVMVVANRIPGYLEYILFFETGQRFATSALQREGPFWYFLAILPAAALPWTIVLGAGARRIRAHLRARDPRTVYLLLWIVVPLVFFTVSQSKRPQYVLPLIPAIALLVARIWHVGGVALAGARAAAGALVLIGAGLVAGRTRLPGLFDAGPELSSIIASTALALGIASLVGGSIVYALGEDRWQVMLALSLPVATIPIIGGPLMRQIARDRSAAPVAAAIEPALPASGEVIAINLYLPGLPFYLGRGVLVSTDDPAVLTSNWIGREPEQARRWPGSPLRDGNWWRAAVADCLVSRVFVVNANDPLTRAELGSILPLLTDTGRFAVYGPCGPPALALTD